MIGKPSRRAQPYRQGPRVPGAALTAMLRGRAANGVNLADVQRAALLYGRRGKRGRQQRPVRPTRPQRQAR